MSTIPNLSGSAISGSSRTVTAATTLSSTDHLLLADATGSLPPTGLSAAAVASGGSFTAGTYRWKVTALGGVNGESVGSNEASQTLVLNGSATLTWTAVPGATGYNIYRSTTMDGESTSPALVTAVGAVTTYTDTGTAVSAGAAPATNSAAFPVTIPTAVGFAGIYWVEAITASQNLVSLNTTSGQVINAGSTSYASGALTLGTPVSGAPYQAIQLMSDGSNWRII